MVVLDFIFALVCIWCGYVVIKGVTISSNEVMSQKDKILSLVIGFVLSFGGWKLLSSLLIGNY